MTPRVGVRGPDTEGDAPEDGGGLSAGAAVDVRGTVLGGLLRSRAEGPENHPPDSQEGASSPSGSPPRLSEASPLTVACTPRRQPGDQSVPAAESGTRERPSVQLKGELPGHLCAKLAATAAAGGRRRMKGERRPHGAAQGAADVKLEEQGGSDAAEDPDISPSVTALGGSDAAEGPDISPSVTALLGRLPRAPEEVCAIQKYTWQQQWLA